MASSPQAAATKAGTMEGDKEAGDAVCTVHHDGSPEADDSIWGSHRRAVDAPGTPEAETLEAATLSVVVVTTVAQARAAVLQAHRSGPGGLVVLGRCAVCGRVGRVVHFDGELRARPREADP